jgi:hypothetical protein
MIYIYKRFSINFHFLQSANCQQLFLIQSKTYLFKTKCDKKILNKNMSDFSKHLCCVKKFFF